MNFQRVRAPFVASTPSRLVNSLGQKTGSRGYFRTALLSRLYRSYYGTLRIRVMLPNGKIVRLQDYPFKPVLFAFSERHSFVLAAALIYCHCTLLIARGRDGDWATRAVESVGSSVVRGSSIHESSQALLTLIRRLRDSSWPSAICVDGPLGPQGKVKPGILACARRVGCPIVPAGAAAKPSIVFRKAWSQIFLPLPFARALIVFGEPLTVSEDADRSQIEGLSEELARRLKDAHRLAEQPLLRVKENECG